MIIQVYVTQNQTLSFKAVLADDDGDWADDMIRSTPLTGSELSYLWKGRENYGAVIHFTVRKKGDAFLLSCRYVTTKNVEFFNFSSKPILIENSADTHSPFKLLPERSRILSEKALTPCSDTPETSFRRPAYWMRGKPVTPEQAFEIIRRTDNYFSWNKAGGQMSGPPKDFLSIYTIDSWWFDNHYPSCYGWCRPDGRIGLDSITQRWPLQKEFIKDGLTLLAAFPFLDMILLLWDSEEEFGFEETPGQPFEMPPIRYGVYFHRQTVRILPPHQAWRIFCYYQLLYGEDPVTYLSEYNDISGKDWVDKDYLKRCLRANGLPEQGAESSIFCSPYRIHASGRKENFRQRYETLVKDCERLQKAMERKKKHG